MSDTPTVTLSPKYRAIIEDVVSRYFLITGGRNSGKSFAISLLIIFTLCEPGQKILYTRYTLVSAEKSIIPEFTEKIRLLGLQDEFVTSRGAITHRKTGSSIIFSGIKTSSGNQTANLKSLNGVTVWIVDEADELPDERTFDDIDRSFRKAGVQNKIILIFNKPPGEHWLFDRFYTPYHIEEEFNGREILYRSEELDTNVYGRYIHTTYEDNIDNIPADYLAMIYSMRRDNYQKYLHVYRGHRTTKVEGALWSRDIIDAYRVDTAPSDLRCIVVGVDPAVTATNTSNETGITVSGLGWDNHFYLLDDCSLVGSPKTWGEAVAAAYTRWSADLIVAEVNQGGDLVISNIHNVNPSLPVKAVRASRGKLLRAEPIATIYEMGLVHHVGKFHTLERQMTEWTPGDVSPDRLDSHVWAISYLMNLTRGVDTIPSTFAKSGQDAKVKKPNLMFGNPSRPPTFTRRRL